MESPGRLSLDSGRDARGGAWGARKAKGGRGCGLDPAGFGKFPACLGEVTGEGSKRGYGFLLGLSGCNAMAATCREYDHALQWMF